MSPMLVLLPQKSKSEVAARAVKELNPDLKIVAMQKAVTAAGVIGQPKKSWKIINFRFVTTKLSKLFRARRVAVLLSLFLILKKVNDQLVILPSSTPGIPDLYLAMYLFSISADEHLHLKFHMTKHFIMTNQSYVRR